MRQPVASATNRTGTQTATHARHTGTDLVLGLLPVVFLTALAAPALTVGVLLGGIASGLLQRAVAHMPKTDHPDPVADQTPV